jgi:hypothetical protein
MATGIGTEVNTAGESLLAVALTLRGAEVQLLLCDKALPACVEAWHDAFPDQAEFINHGPRRTICEVCFGSGQAAYTPLGLPVHYYSTLITEAEREEARQLSQTLPLGDLRGYRLDGVAVGEHAWAGAIRFFVRGDLEGEPRGEAVLRRYFNGALVTAAIVKRLLAKVKFDAMAVFDGIYVPPGVVGEVARRYQVRLAHWVLSYRNHCLMLSHHEPLHRTLLSEPNERWENLDLTAGMQAELMTYLGQRWSDKHNWLGSITLEAQPQHDVRAIEQEVGLDFSKPTIGLLTNIMWDAQLFYPSNAFPDALDWTIRTIEYFARRPDLQLLIRVHPHEVRGSLVSRQPILQEIAKVYPRLPDNVFTIPPESPIDTYTTMLQCNAAIIYGTRTGQELASLGVPVIVAGEAWIRNKGVALDAHSAEEYFQLLDRLPLPQRLSPEQTLRAQKYAYHFYFRRMIPLACLTPTGAFPPYRLDVHSLDDLMPGRDAGLDVICDGLLSGSDFIYPAEAYREPGAAG